MGFVLNSKHWLGLPSKKLFSIGSLFIIKIGYSKITPTTSFALLKFICSSTSVVSRNFLKSEVLLKVYVADSLRSFISLCH